jgi:glycylpeptide N-tetradecanoyltransferase
MHEFWNKQPVPQDKVVFEKDGEINSSRKLRYEKNPLPEGYEWSSCTVDELYEFLKENYIRDEFFEFQYSKELVKWATQPPDHIKECNIAIRKSDTGEIVVFNSGVPANVRINEKNIKMLQANFLCVSKNIRDVKFTPTIISEQVRRMNLNNIWSGISTIVKRIPTPIAKVKYWHRLINVKKLNRVGFSNAREQAYRILGTSQFREMTEHDIPRVTQMLRDHLNQFKLSLEIDESYVKHWILPRKDTVYTYLNDEKDQFATFYSLDYVHKPSGETIKQAYTFYNVGNCLKDAIIMARNRGFDVYNCLNVGVDEEELREHKFMEGTGHNHYYLWNWKISEEIKPKDIGFVII